MNNKNKSKHAIISFALLMGSFIIVTSWLFFGRYAIIAMALLAIWSVVVENAWLKVKHLTVASPKLQQSLKLLQISDFHANSWVLGQIKRVIEQEQPEVVVLTGDVFDAEKANNQAAKRLMLYLANLDIPVLLIYGNHETEYPQFWQRVKRSVPVTVKQLNRKTYQINADVACYGADYGSQIRQVKLDSDRFNLLLTHTPHEAERYADRLAFDLILCGHEHGGQVRLPLIGAIINAQAKLLSEWRGQKTRGLYQWKDALIYIDSGAGYSTLPVRLMCRAQVTIVKLQNN